MARGEVPTADAYAPPGMNSQVCYGYFLLLVVLGLVSSPKGPTEEWGG